MNKTEKTAFRESVIVVMMGMVINFPLQTFLNLEKTESAAATLIC